MDLPQGTKVVAESQGTSEVQVTRYGLVTQLGEVREVKEPGQNSAGTHSCTSALLDSRARRGISTRHIVRG